MKLFISTTLILLANLSPNSAFALVDPFKAKEAHLCEPCTLGEFGYLQYSQGTKGTMAGKACLNSLTASYKKNVAKYNKCIKPHLTKLNKKKITKTKYKSLIKSCGANKQAEYAYLKFLGKQQGKACVNPGNGLLISSPKKPKFVPGQLCHMNYFRYDCTLTVHATKAGIQGQGSCYETGFTVAAVHQDVDVALVKSAALAAENIITIGSEGFNQANAELQAYTTQALSIVMAGGVPPPLTIHFSFALSPQGQENFDQSAFSPLEFMGKVGLALTGDLVGRVVPFRLKFLTTQGLLLQQFGTSEAKNIQGVAAYEAMIPDALSLMHKEWSDVSFSWTNNIIEKCLLVN